MKSLLDDFPRLGFIVGFGFLALIMLRERPRALVAVWLATICFVPWWTGVEYHTFFPIAVLISLFAFLCLQPVVVRQLTMLDWAALGFFVVCLIPTVLGAASQASTYGIVFVWVPAYLVGRMVTPRTDFRWIYGCVAVLFTIVSALAILEFLLDWNPFVHFRTLAGPTYDLWAPRLKRGGRFRVEGAFGHPIALGSSIALAVPMALGSRFRVSLRLLSVGLMIGATVLTFSRTGMLSAFLGMALSVVFLRGGLTTRARVAVTSVVIALSVAFVPLVTSTFAAAGSEATNSADYRGQLTSLISSMDLVGLAGSAQRLPDGTLMFGGFRSIDSQIILLGLTYGLLAMVLCVTLLISAICAVLIGRASTATIAVAAQIPSLATVALITQYSVFVWFVVGMAVATQAARAGDPSWSRTSDACMVSVKKSRSSVMHSGAERSPGVNAVVSGQGTAR